MLKIGSFKSDFFLLSLGSKCNLIACKVLQITNHLYFVNVSVGNAEKNYVVIANKNMIITI